MKTKQKGFTLVELIFVILILAIVSLIAIGRFNTLSSDAAGATVESVTGSVKEGLQLFYSKQVTNKAGTLYPNRLDTNPLSQPCVTCFSNILQQPIKSKFWTKDSDLQYTYNNQGVIRTCTYTPATGLFECN